MNFMTFHILGIMIPTIPTDFHILQRGRSTTNLYFSLTSSRFSSAEQELPEPPQSPDAELGAIKRVEECSDMLR